LLPIRRRAELPIYRRAELPILLAMSLDVASSRQPRRGRQETAAWGAGCESEEGAVGGSDCGSKEEGAAGGETGTMARWERREWEGGDGMLGRKTFLFLLVNRYRRCDV